MGDDQQGFTVPWDTVVHETGIVPEAGWYPDRYRVHDWPDPSVIARLRAADTML